MEANILIKASTEIHRTTPHYIPEDSALHNHRYKNLKSSIC
jgi:hypothetical protein